MTGETRPVSMVSVCFSLTPSSPSYSKSLDLKSLYMFKCFFQITPKVLRNPSIAPRLSTLTSGLLGGGGWCWRHDLTDSAGFKGLMKPAAFSSRLWQLCSREALSWPRLRHIAPAFLRLLPHSHLYLLNKIKAAWNGWALVWEMQINFYFRYPSLKLGNNLGALMFG